MPRLSGVVRVAIFATTVLASEAARADDRWTFDARMGYAASFTTGQSYLGPGTGLALGITLPTRFHFEAALTAYAGSVEAAVARGLVFRSRQTSVAGLASVGYDFEPLSTLCIRPSLLAGAVFVAGSTRLDDRRLHDLTPLATVGPGVLAVGRIAGIHLGVDLQAFFVPARVASPILAAFAVIGVER